MTRVCSGNGDEDIEEILDRIVRRGPAVMPSEQYLTLESQAGLWGRRKLRESFLREANLRYGAEAALREFGFVQDGHGKWSLPRRQ